MDKKAEEKIAVLTWVAVLLIFPILDVGENVVEVISTNGYTHLGGDDFDDILIQ